jgi:uncharacterized hydrophobic protein (TIGR00271 family)
MAFAQHLRLATEKDKTVAVARLVKSSTGDFDFYLFALLGIAMASMGLVLNSPEVVIGSMLIAPVLYPLLSIALALVLSDGKLIMRSVRTLVISFGVSVFVSFVLSLFLGAYYDMSITDQILARAQPSTLYFVVAFVSGFAATYALVNANLNEMLPGVAISVSLVPPLAVVGLGLGSYNYEVALGALVLFLINVLGILLASAIAFTMMDVHSTHKVAESAVRQEELRIEKENLKIEEIKEQTNHDTRQQTTHHP